MKLKQSDLNPVGLNLKNTLVRAIIYKIRTNSPYSAHKIVEKQAWNFYWSQIVSKVWTHVCTRDVKTFNVYKIPKVDYESISKSS